MNPVSTSTIEEVWPRRVNTKVVGTTFEGRQELLAQCIQQGIARLALVPDPTNRFDSHAVAIEAKLHDGEGSTKTARLGFLCNSDRVCSDCGAVVGGELFTRSRTLQCRECAYVFTYDDPAVTARGGYVLLTCPKCGEPINLDLAKYVVCSECGGTDFGRGGLATLMSRALAAGVEYQVRVLSYTGGGVGPDGQRRSIGCNIRIERISD